MFTASAPRVFAAEAPQVTTKLLSQAYYVDLHLHTSYSLDTYLGGATGVDPDTPYRFARGEVVDYMGQPRYEACLSATPMVMNIAS
jgi:hypothetical protein